MSNWKKYSFQTFYSFISDGSLLNCCHFPQKCYIMFPSVGVPSRDTRNWDITKIGYGLGNCEVGQADSYYTAKDVEHFAII